jgi:hypothetical protein
LLTALLELAPLARRVRRGWQAFGLGGMIAHATGHLARWYYEHWWYDDMLHLSLVLGASLLSLRTAQALDLFPRRHSTALRAGILTFGVALALAGAWEIFEFTMDEIQGTREQDDLRDTMRDMIDGTVGGVLAASWAAAHPKPSRPPRARAARA